MARKKKPVKEFVLVSLGKREFARKGRSYITTHVDSGRPMDLPKGYDHWRDGWAWAQVTEIIVDPKHGGPATYRFEDWQHDRIQKIISRGPD